MCYSVNVDTMMDGQVKFRILLTSYNKINDKPLNKEGSSFVCIKKYPIHYPFSLIIDYIFDCS